MKNMKKYVKIADFSQFFIIFYKNANYFYVCRKY